MLEKLENEVPQAYVIDGTERPIVRPSNPDDQKFQEPKKKPKGLSLTNDEKKSNQLISSIRVVVGHVISGIERLRIVKDLFRNTTADYNDLVVELACALHNFRSFYRLKAC